MQWNTKSHGRSDHGASSGVTDEGQGYQSPLRES